MTPRASSTPSEGEILESDSEKATTSQPSVHGTSVDRPFRTRAAIPSHRSRSPQRDRSRSPYRAPRGEKRRRDDGHLNDGKGVAQRNPAARYEDYNDRKGQRRPKSYADLDGPNDPGAYRRRDDAYADKRARTRSRSPYRHDRRQEMGSHLPHREQERPDRRREHMYEKRNGRLSFEQSVSARGNTSVDARDSKADAETKSSQMQQDVSMSSSNAKATEYVYSVHRFEYIC